MKKRHNFRELKIWKESMILVKKNYALTSRFPKDEKYGLTSQINRCSTSIASNIAEGSGRTSQKEFLYFFNVSLASSYELETQLILVEDIFKIDTKSILIDLTALQKMIGAFKRMLKTE